MWSSIWPSKQQEGSEDGPSPKPTNSTKEKDAAASDCDARSSSTSNHNKSKKRLHLFDEDATTAASSLTTKQQQHVHVGGLRRLGTDGATTTTATAAFQQFYDAMSLIDPQEKKEWEDAQQHCSPVVLQQESCPCYFLAACQSNPWDAAKRMCSYWKERIDLFQDRAFDPIVVGTITTSTGEDKEGEDGGCVPTGLTNEDVQVLETGCMQLLPCDRQGRSVIFMDRSKLKPHMHHDTRGRLRVLWYIIQKAYTSGSSQAYRMVFLALLSQPPHSGYDWQYAAGSSRMPLILPIVVDSIHYLTLPASSGTGRIKQAVIAASLNMLGNAFQHLVKVHHGASITGSSANSTNGSSQLAEKEEVIDDASGLGPHSKLLQQLKQYGLSKRGLPQCAGGLITDDSFQNWLRKQQRIEQVVYWTAAQRTQRRRDINRVHSRQKRQRRRQEFQELQQQVENLILANAKAKRVQCELQLLLNKALEITRELEPSSNFPSTDLSLPYATTCAAAAAVESAPTLTSNLAGTSDPGMANNAEDPPHTASLSNILAVLEPDPIAPTCIPNTATPGTTTRGTTDAPPLQPLLATTTTNVAAAAATSFGEGEQATDPLLPYFWRQIWEVTNNKSEQVGQEGQSQLLPTPAISYHSLQASSSSQSIAPTLDQSSFHRPSMSLNTCSVNGGVPPLSLSTALHETSPPFDALTCNTNRDSNAITSTLQNLNVAQLRLILQEQQHNHATGNGTLYTSFEAAAHQLQSQLTQQLPAMTMHAISTTATSMVPNHEDANALSSVLPLPLTAPMATLGDSSSVTLAAIANHSHQQSSPLSSQMISMWNKRFPFRQTTSNPSGATMNATNLQYHDPSSSVSLGDNLPCPSLNNTNDDHRQELDTALLLEQEQSDAMSSSSLLQLDQHHSLFGWNPFA